MEIELLPAPSARSPEPSPPALDPAPASLGLAARILVRCWRRGGRSRRASPRGGGLRGRRAVPNFGSVFLFGLFFASFACWTRPKEKNPLPATPHAGLILAEFSSDSPSEPQGTIDASLGACVRARESAGGCGDWTADRPSPRPVRPVVVVSPSSRLLRSVLVAFLSFFASAAALSPVTNLSLCFLSLLPSSLFFLPLSSSFLSLLPSSLSFPSRLSLPLFLFSRMPSHLSSQIMTPPLLFPPPKK